MAAVVVALPGCGSGANAKPEDRLAKLSTAEREAAISREAARRVEAALTRYDNVASDLADIEIEKVTCSPPPESGHSLTCEISYNLLADQSNLFATGHGERFFRITFARPEGCIEDTFPVDEETGDEVEDYLGPLDVDTTC